MPYLAYQSITWITAIQCSQVKVVVQLPLLPRGWISSSSEYLSDFISPSDMLVSIEPSPTSSALCISVITWIESFDRKELLRSRSFGLYRQTLFFQRMLGRATVLMSFSCLHWQSLYSFRECWEELLRSSPLLIALTGSLFFQRVSVHWTRCSPSADPIHTCQILMLLSGLQTVKWGLKTGTSISTRRIFVCLQANSCW